MMRNHTSPRKNRSDAPLSELEEAKRRLALSTDAPCWQATKEPIIRSFTWGAKGGKKKTKWCIHLRRYKSARQTIRDRKQSSVFETSLLAEANLFHFRYSMESKMGKKQVDEQVRFLQKKRKSPPVVDFVDPTLLVLPVRPGA